MEETPEATVEERELKGQAKCGRLVLTEAIEACTRCGNLSRNQPASMPCGAKCQVLSSCERRRNARNTKHRAAAPHPPQDLQLRHTPCLPPTAASLLPPPTAAPVQSCEPTG
eukprot:SAG22_NODE_27_length_29018_cov_465.809646_3_plen_112_part_00